MRAGLSLNKHMIYKSQGIQTFVLDKISPEYQGIRAHPDSSTGLRTSVYADGMEVLFSTDVSRSKLMYDLAVFIA